MSGLRGWQNSLIGIGSAVIVPCIVAGVVMIFVKCLKAKNSKKTKVRSSHTVPPTNERTNINLETDPNPPAYDQLNFNTLNQTAHPVNNTNFSSNMGFNSSDQIMPVLPSALNASQINNTNR